MRSLQLLRAYGEQAFIALDQLANALIPPIDGTVSYADALFTRHLYSMARKIERTAKTTNQCGPLTNTMKGHHHG